MVLGSKRQTRNKTARAECDPELCAPRALGFEFVATDAKAFGGGDGCHNPQKYFYGVEHQPCLSWLRDPCGVDDPARQLPRRLETTLVAAVLVPRSNTLGRLVRDRDGRSRTLCEVALLSDSSLGLASVFAHQHDRHLSPRGCPVLGVVRSRLLRQKSERIGPDA